MDRQNKSMLIGFLYAISYSVYIACFVGFIILLIVMAFPGSPISEINKVLLLIFGITIASIFFEYTISVFIGGGLALLFIVAAFIYLLYEAATTPSSNAIEIDTIILLCIMLYVGWSIYSRQRTAISRTLMRAGKLKKNQKLKISGFRRYFWLYMEAQNRDTIPSAILPYAMVSFLVVVIILAVLNALSILYITIFMIIPLEYFYQRIAHSVRYFPITALSTLAIFLLTYEYIMPIFSHTSPLYYNGGIMVLYTAIAAISLLVVSAAFMLLNIKEAGRILREIKSNPGNDENKSMSISKFRSNSRNRQIFFAVAFSAVLLIGMLGGFESGETLTGQNVYVYGYSPPAEFSVTLLNPYGGLVLFMPHGTQFTATLSINVSNTEYNYLNPLTINNIYLTPYENQSLEILSFSQGRMSTGSNTVNVHMLVKGAYFAGVIDLDVDVNQ
ncbi:MAG: hypothetical protein QXP70_02335 [Methanomassiliicoccales archaeon]